MVCQIMREIQKGKIVRRKNVAHLDTFLFVLSFIFFLNVIFLHVNIISHLKIITSPLKNSAPSFLFVFTILARERCEIIGCEILFQNK